nr:KGG domain-containing protein [uncultured Shinella sp.]
MPNQGGTHEQHVKAGQQSHKNGDQTRQASDNRDQNDGNRGGKGNFAQDREKASEAGRKGGKH